MTLQSEGFYSVAMTAVRSQGITLGINKTGQKHVNCPYCGSVHAAGQGFADCENWTKSRKGTVLENGDRKHLTTREVEKLLNAARGGRHAARDRCLLFLMFRHGLRVPD